VEARKEREVIVAPHICVQENDRDEESIAFRDRTVRTHLAESSALIR
jgi:hypothetical protein